MHPSELSGLNRSSPSMQREDMVLSVIGKSSIYQGSLLNHPITSLVGKRFSKTRFRPLLLTGELLLRFFRMLTLISASPFCPGHRKSLKYSRHRSIIFSACPKRFMVIIVSAIPTVNFINTLHYRLTLESGKSP